MYRQPEAASPMSTCSQCHQAIPFSCNRDDCDDQIIVRDGVPMSYPNHHKKHAVKKPVVRVGKAPVATAEEQQSLIDAIEEQGG